MANITKSASKTLTAPASSSAKYKLTAKFEETSVDTTNNKSTIKVTAILASDSGYSFSGSTKHTLKIYWYDNNDNDGGKSVETTTVTSMSAGGSSTATGNITVPHKADGSLKGYAKAVWSKGGSNSYVPPSGNVSTAETAVTSIARTPVFTVNPIITNTTETSITIDRGATNISSNFTYSISPNVGTLSTSGTTATYTGLSANTSYTITVTATNSANISLSASKTVTATTWAWPSISSIAATALTPGNAQTIYLNNPHSRSVTWYMRMNSTSTSSGAQVSTGTTSGTSVTFTPSVDTLFNATNGLGTAKTSINAFYYITYGGNTSSKTGTIAITEANYKPVWGSVSAAAAIEYQDVDETTVVITGREKKIVAGKSKLEYKYKSSGNAATANRSTISKYQVSVNGSAYTDITKDTWSSQEDKLVPIDATGVTISLIAIDARNYKSDPLTLTVANSNFYKYTNPTGAIEVKRLNNNGEQIQLKINPVWAVGSKNANKARIRYKLSTASSWTTLTSNYTTFNSLNTISGTYDNSQTYNFEVVLTDKFGGTSSAIVATVGPGTTIMFIDSETNSVGFNCFPRENSAIDVAGPAYFSDSVQFDGAIQKNHYAVVGQSDNTAGTNTWYKFASITLNNISYADKNILFKVYSGYGDSSNAIGELIAHVRTNGDKVVETGSTQLKWIYCGSNIETEKFVMAYYNDTSGTNPIVNIELWVNVTQSWRRYKFIPQAEGDIEKEDAGQWTLYKTRTDSGQSAPTAGYTLITSTLGSLKNSIDGNASTATTATNATSAYKLTAPEDGRPTSANLDHEYTGNRATKRLDLATSAMTTGKPSSDGWIETYFWDNSGSWDSQLFLPNTESKHLQFRARKNSSWPSSWKELAYVEDIPTLPADTGWKNVPLASGISDGGTIPQYKKVGNQVFLRGDYSGTKTAGTALDLGYLPEGFRPPDNVYILAVGNGARVGRVYITKDGAIGVDWIYLLTSDSEYSGKFSWLSFTLSYWVD